jgi:hypothetical protein
MCYYYPEIRKNIDYQWTLNGVGELASNNALQQ